MEALVQFPGGVAVDRRGHRALGGVRAHLGAVAAMRHAGGDQAVHVDGTVAHKLALLDGALGEALQVLGDGDRRLVGGGPQGGQLLGGDLVGGGARLGDVGDLGGDVVLR